MIKNVVKNLEVSSTLRINEISKELESQGKKLFKFGIETRSFFWPMNKQNILKKMNYKFKGTFKNSEFLSKYGLYLPSGLGITKKEINFVAETLNKILK